MLTLSDTWIWDFWLAREGGWYHLFHLRAPKSLGDPELRHANASIGHAVSADLRSWTVLPPVLSAADGAAVDDVATWTGSVVRGPDGLWRMFYTGVARRDGVPCQQIALAVSDDLTTWRRYGDGPILHPDPSWYAVPGGPGEPPPHWRDPWVFADPDGDGWHMLITAQSPHGPEGDRGVIGHARSADLVTWELAPPVSEPGSGFGQVEVPQVHLVDGRPVLLFSCLREHLAPGRRDGAESAGTWALAVDSLTGPFDVAAARPLTDDSLYSGRLVDGPDGRTVLLAFRNTGPDGRFVGTISDPLPVAWRRHDLRPEPTARLVVRG